MLGFKGLDADNIEWQTFFDMKTKMIRKAVSGGGIDQYGQKSTMLEFDIEGHG